MAVRILLVEDNLDTIRTYTKALTRSATPPPTIITADTVPIALQSLKEDSFDIVVVDLKISGAPGEAMGGLKVINASLELDTLRPVIVVTGYGSVELAKKTLTRGAFDFIEKSTGATQELVDAVQRALDYRDERTRLCGNPFTPSTSVEPTVFGGRKDELLFLDDRLARALHANRYEHFLIFGGWGIGKSTLLRECKKICQAKGLIAALVPVSPVQANSDLLTAIHTIVEGIVRDLPYPVGRLKRLMKYLDSVGISVMGTGLQVSKARRNVTAQAFLHDSLTELWRDLEEKTNLLVILLDDVDNVTNVPEVLMTLKGTLSMDSLREKTKILVGMALPKRSWLDVTSVEALHPLNRYFMARRELGNLSEKEVIHVITMSLKESGVSFSQEVTQRVFESTNGHPFEMQVLCYHLFNNQLLRRVDGTVFEKSLTSAIEDMAKGVFDHWLSRMSSGAIEVLRVIADSDVPLSAEEIRSKLSEKGITAASRSLANYLRSLTAKRLVGRDGDRYTVYDNMFCAYVQSYIEPRVQRDTDEN